MNNNKKIISIIMAILILSTNPKFVCGNTNNVFSENEKNNFDNEIKKYASYFNLNADLLIKLAREYTYNYCVKGTMNVNNTIMDLTNSDIFALNFVYDVFKNYELYNINKNDLFVSNDITTLNYNDNKKNVNEEYTYEEYLKFISKNADIDYNLALAISYYETGFLESNQARFKNNFGGLKGNNGYLTYSSPEAGIIIYVYTLKNIIEEYNINSIEELSGVYVNGNKNIVDYHWVNSVISIKNDIESKKIY